MLLPKRKMLRWTFGTVSACIGLCSLQKERVSIPSFSRVDRFFYFYISDISGNQFCIPELMKLLTITSHPTQKCKIDDVWIERSSRSIVRQTSVCSLWARNSMELVLETTRNDSGEPGRSRIPLESQSTLPSKKVPNCMFVIVPMVCAHQLDFRLI